VLLVSVAVVVEVLIVDADDGASAETLEGI
jgi:hypothetical protein